MSEYQTLEAPKRERLTGWLGDGDQHGQARRGEAGRMTASKARGWLIDNAFNMASPGQAASQDSLVRGMMCGAHWQQTSQWPL